jgi:hypothetical protein
MLFTLNGLSEFIVIETKDLGEVLVFLHGHGICCMMFFKSGVTLMKVILFRLRQCTWRKSFLFTCQLPTFSISRRKDTLLLKGNDRI